MRIIPYLPALIGVLLPAYLLRFKIFGIPTTVLEVSIWLTFAALLIFGPRPRLRLADLPYLLFVAGAILGTFVAPDKQVALGIFKAWFLAPLLLFYLTRELSREEKVRYSTLLGIIVGGLIVALEALVEWLRGDLTVDGRVLGIYNDSPNFIALYLAPIAAASATLSLFGRTPLLTAPATAVMLLAILASGSRGGLVGLAFGLVLAVSLTLARTYPKLRRLIATAAILLTLFGIALTAFLARPNLAASPTQGLRVVSSNNIRYEIWKTTAEILQGKWLAGVGLGNFQRHFSELSRGRVNYPEFIAPVAVTPHNLLLTVWVNLGLIGLFAFLWIIARIITFLARSEILNDPTLAAPGAAFAAIFAHGFLDTPYFKNDLSALFFLLLALVAGCVEGSGSSSSSSSLPWRSTSGSSGEAGRNRTEGRRNWRNAQPLSSGASAYIRGQLSRPITLLNLPLGSSKQPVTLA